VREFGKERESGSERVGEKEMERRRESE